VSDLGAVGHVVALGASVTRTQNGRPLRGYSVAVGGVRFSSPGSVRDDVVGNAAPSQRFTGPFSTDRVLWPVLAGGGSKLSTLYAGSGQLVTIPASVPTTLSDEHIPGWDFDQAGDSAVAVASVTSAFTTWLAANVPGVTSVLSREPRELYTRNTGFGAAVGDPRNVDPPNNIDYNPIGPEVFLIDDLYYVSDRTISVDVMFDRSAEGPRPHVVLRASPSLGVPVDVTVGALSSATWQTLTVRVKPTGTGVLDLVRENFHLARDRRVWWDNVAVT
jgi:hypothetical protein